jgi:hypothetical protein
MGGIGEIVMPEQAAQQGRAATQGGSRLLTEGRASSRSKVIGISVAGALLTAAAIAGVVMMSGPASAPVGTQVAAVSAPYAAAPTSAVAPTMVPAPVAPAQTIAPATNFAPVPPPVTTPAPAPAPAVSDIAQPFAGLPRPAPAPALNTSGQCEVGQRQQLSLILSATEKREVGNVIRIHSGSYVSPPITLTRDRQTVTFPAPPGSTNSARIILEQSNSYGGSTFDDSDGIISVFERHIDDHRSSVLLHWSRC